MSVTEVEGSVFLLWGDHLTDVSGLDRLARVGGDLHLVGHGNNQPIKGFDGLTELGGHLIIAGFDGESIDAFNGLRHAEGGDHPALSLGAHGAGRLSFVGVRGGARPSLQPHARPRRGV